MTWWYHKSIMHRRFPVAVSLIGLFTALVLGALFIPMLGASAAEESVRLQPAIIEERAIPGDVYRTTLRVTNLGTDEKTFFFFTKDIESLTDGKPVFSETPNPVYGLAEWVKLGISSLRLKSGEMREVPITVTVPENATPGSHIGGIFTSLEAIRPETTGVGIGYEVGTIVTFRIAGDVTEEARIREFRTTKTVYREPTASFSVRVENVGNVLVKPRGPLEVTDMFGRTVATAVVNVEGSAIFPKSERTFESGWVGGRFSIGRFQATVALVYGEDGRKTITATPPFWILPLDTILPTAIVAC